MGESESLVSRFKELKLPGNALDTLIERLGGTNKVEGLGFRVQGSWFRVQGAGCRVDTAFFPIPHAGLMMSAPEARASLSITSQSCVELGVQPPLGARGRSAELS